MVLEMVGIALLGSGSSHKCHGGNRSLTSEGVIRTLVGPPTRRDGQPFIKLNPEHADGTYMVEPAQPEWQLYL